MNNVADSKMLQMSLTLKRELKGDRKWSRQRLSKYNHGLLRNYPIWWTWYRVVIELWLRKDRRLSSKRGQSISLYWNFQEVEDTRYDGKLQRSTIPKRVNSCEQVKIIWWPRRKRRNKVIITWNSRSTSNDSIDRSLWGEHHEFSFRIFPLYYSPEMAFRVRKTQLPSFFSRIFGGSKK